MNNSASDYLFILFVHKDVIGVLLINHYMIISFMTTSFFKDKCAKNTIELD